MVQHAAWAVVVWLAAEAPTHGYAAQAQQVQTYCGLFM
jgi:hypothetical protein